MQNVVFGLNESLKLKYFELLIQISRHCGLDCRFIIMNTKSLRTTNSFHLFSSAYSIQRSWGAGAFSRVHPELVASLLPNNKACSKKRKSKETITELSVKLCYY